MRIVGGENFEGWRNGCTPWVGDESEIYSKKDSMRKRMGSPRHAKKKRRRRTREVPNLSEYDHPWSHCRRHTQGVERWVNILPWYRLVGAARTSCETQKRKNQAALDGTCPPCGTGTTVLTYPGSESRWQARLVKTVTIQVRLAAIHHGQDRRLLGVVTHSKLQKATSVRSRVGIVLEDDSRVAIDWVTSQSYSSARRRLIVQSDQCMGK